jgi:hypothetical protein
VPQLNFTIPADLLDRIDAAKPNYLDRKGFLCLLLEQQLDKGCTLVGPSEAGTTSITSYIPTVYKKQEYKAVIEGVNSSKNEPVEVPEARPVKARKSKVKGSQEFEQFWRQYQAIKRRASSQSKPRALEVWSEVVSSVSPEALCQALGRAVTQQARLERDGGFASPFPDCFRWLRDGYYEAFLDAPTATGAGPDLTPPTEHADCPF